MTTVPVGYSTWIDQSAPNANHFGRTAYMRLQSTAGSQARGIVWFANPFTAQGGNVASAKLRLTTRALPSGTHTINVRLADPSWAPRFGSVHWANQPAVVGPTASATKVGAQPNWAVWELDVTTIMQLVASGQPFTGLVITTTTGTPILVEGNYSAAVNPQLTVDWSLAPQKPGSLSPAGGRVIGVSDPVLRWDWRDVAGDTTMRGFQVQVATSSGSFTSPTHDSGLVLSSWCQCQPPTDTFPAGQVRWWRVRNQDGAGLWSDWSDPTSALFVAKLGVTLTNPTGPTTSDVTPPLVWSVTGGTQHSWRAAVYVRGVFGEWAVLDHTNGIRIGTDTTWTPTVAVPAGAQMRAVVDVWDSQQREATPGVPLYSSASVELVHVPGPIPGVTALIATPDPLLPEVTLEWSRAEVPDEWVVARDGVTIGRVPGAGLLQPGGSFRFVDPTAPNGEHQWLVWAIVNAVSAPSGAVSTTPAHPPVWLVHPDTGERVCISGWTGGGTRMSEQGTDLVPLGSRARVRIVTSQHGRGDTASGRLVELSGMPTHETPALWRERLLAWRPLVGTTLRLVMGSMSIPVRIANINVEEMPHQGGGKAWAVSFDWWQVGEWPSEVLP